MKAEVIREIAERHADKSARLGTVRHNNTRQRHESTIFSALRILEQAGFVVLPKEELEAALKPFADIADEYADQEDGDFCIWQDFDVLGSVTKLDVNDCRQARALLAAITQDPTT